MDYLDNGVLAAYLGVAIFPGTPGNVPIAIGILTRLGPLRRPRAMVQMAFFEPISLPPGKIATPAYLTARTCLDMLRTMSMSLPKIFLAAIIVLAAFVTVLAGHLPSAAAVSGQRLHSSNRAAASLHVAKATFAVYLKSSSPVNKHGCCLLCGHQTGTLQVCSTVTIRDHKPPRHVMALANPACTDTRVTIYRWSPRISPRHTCSASSLFDLGCALTI